MVGRRLAHDPREIANAILHQSRTGYQWRFLPNEFPPHSTVHEWFIRWRDAGTWTGSTTRCGAVNARSRRFTGSAHRCASRPRLRVGHRRRPQVHPRPRPLTIERSLAWFGTHRLLGKHALEHTTAAAETWVRIASIVIMFDRLYAEPGNPQSLTWTTWTT